MKQYTFKKEFEVSGIALHSGLPVKVKFIPTSETSGIKFKRTDIKGSELIPALWSSVISTNMCTTIGTSKENSVNTIEHLMAALWAFGIDNCLVEIDNIEVPIMDGSAKNWLEEFEKIGKVEQSYPRKFLKILKEVVFQDERATVKLLPAEDFEIHTYINHNRKMIGEQEFDSPLNQETFASEIASARTHGHVNDHEQLKAMGLARGASLDNLLVYDDEKVLSNEGLRYKNEIVRHTTLDAIGDLYTSGYFIIGRYETSKGGHKYNNEILKVLFSDPENFTII